MKNQMTVLRYLFSRVFFLSNYVNCCYLASLVLIIFFGWGSNSILAGTSSSYEIGKQPLHTHPIDILVQNEVRSWSDSDFSFEVSNFSGYSGYSPLSVHTIKVHSTLKRSSLIEVEEDISKLLTKIVYSYNRIPQIRPYLEVFPVGLEDVWLYIEYGSKPKSIYLLPYFCFARLTPINKYEIEVKQWTDSSLLSVGQQPSIKRNALDISSIAILRNFSMKREKDREIALISVKDKLKKCSFRQSLAYTYPVVTYLCSTYQISCSALQNGGFDRLKSRGVSAGFWAQNKEMKLEEAQKFCNDFIETYLREIRKNKVIEKSYRKDSEAFKDFNENLNWFCFRITFWDEYLNRVEEPYIAQIQCQDGKIMYFTADEGQRLQQVFEEPVPERFFPNSKSL